MGYGVRTSGQEDPSHLTGVPVSGINLGARDQYEFGSITSLTRQGRYKSFATAFTARPMVVITPMRSVVGTIIPVLAGTPNTGSFNSRLVIPGGAAGAGSFNAFYLAFGAR